MVTFLCNGEKWDHIGPLRDLALEYGHRYVITDSIEDIGRILPEVIKSGKTKVIGILGGDGTIFQVINPLLRDMDNDKTLSCPPIAILGGGTMNGLFRYLGGKGSPEEVARRIVRKTQRENLQTRRMPLLRIEHAGQIYFGFTFCVGPIVRLLKKYTDEQRNVGNAVWTAVGSSLASVTGWPISFKRLIYPMSASVIINDSEKCSFAETTGLLAATMPRTIFGFHPFASGEPDGTLQTGEFFSIISGLKSFEIIARLPYLAFCGLWQELRIKIPKVLADDPRYLNRPVQSLKIDGRESFFTVDGEVIIAEPNQSIIITRGPELALVYPL